MIGTQKRNLEIIESLRKKDLTNKIHKKGIRSNFFNIVKYLGMRGINFLLAE
jgi:hypothetical protein